ncbi:High-affinity nicotinic acid transporter [Lasiodiplodia theobromae]|uniref:High-affinity nicotinic acid transporter n=1 Tax=Lasiodiplodia theobromae TaxID=45133 RepID=A0A5N5DCF3_9PEZI|nr:High-affinity nicotinic acid transporter [Lasiodiplodia theobromae]
MSAPDRLDEAEKAYEVQIESNNAGGSGGQQLAAADPAAEKRVVRKLDYHVVPLLMALYLLAFLDRSNIGNAKIAGMEEDLELDGDRYDWLLTIFYISYIVFEFQAIMWKIVPPHRWAAICVFGWGLVATVQAATHNWQGMMALRFLMGVFEAGYGPGIPYLLSFFYLRHEVGSRQGIFLSAAPLANTFAGALAYGITAAKDSAIARWRLLFLVEGAPTLVMAAVAWFFLPDAPEKARFLDEDEKRIAKARAVRQTGQDAEARIGGVEWKDVVAALMDLKCWFTALMYFSCNVSFASLPVFLPTILKEMGFTAINAQGLTAPPYFLSFLLTIFTTVLADRTQQRAYTIAALTVIGGTGYVLLAACTSVAARYAGVFLAAAGVFPAIANILPWVSNNQGSDTRRGIGFVILNVVGQCGPLLGTRLYPAGEGPRYVKGQAVCAAFMFFTTFLVVALRVLLAWENGRLDRKYGTVEEQRARREAGDVVGGKDGQEEGVGEENYGPMFRYVL